MKVEPCKIQFNKMNQHLNPKIQKICFKNNIGWYPVGKNIYRPESPFLFIAGYIEFMDHGEWEKGSLSEGQENFNDDERPEITPEDFIKMYGEKPKQAERNNIGKIPLSYLLDFPLAMLEFCRVCMNGAKKYKRDNWKKGRPYRDTIDSLLRHVQAFQNGEGYYEEELPSGEKVKFHHMANAMWNCAALLEWSLSNREDLDDRYKK